MPSPTEPGNRGVRLAFIQSTRPMVAIMDLTPAANMGATPWLLIFIATAFSPHSTQRIVKSEAAFRSKDDLPRGFSMGSLQSRAAVQLESPDPPFP